MSTKSNTKLTYPCIVNITKAMGTKRKEPVIRALNLRSADQEDLSKMIVYPTLRNAFVAGFNLIKETIDSKWQRISMEDTKLALESLEATGALPPKPAKVVPVKVAKVKVAKVKATKPAKSTAKPVGANTKVITNRKKPAPTPVVDDQAVEAESAMS